MFKTEKILTEEKVIIQVFKERLPHIDEEIRELSLNLENLKDLEFHNNTFYSI